MWFIAIFYNFIRLKKLSSALKIFLITDQSFIEIIYNSFDLFNYFQTQNFQHTQSLISYESVEVEPVELIFGQDIIFLFAVIYNNIVGMSEKKDQNYEFVLKIQAVKMKIKFPCRMALEYNKQPITKEVPTGEGNRFPFNEDITLRGEGDGQVFQILANLYTDKGTRYTSGIMKLLGAELLRSQGERLVIPLAKCLDPEAFCELKVEQVTNLVKNQLKMSKSNSKILASPQKPQILSPQIKKINSQRYLIGQTRSEANFQQNGGALLGSDEGKLREGGPKSQIFKTFTKSPNNKFSQIKYVTYNGNFNQVKNQSQFHLQEATSQRQKFNQSQVYRQGYQKLKQKYKKQAEGAKQEAHKRMLLQANQNNYKLQIMKMKLKIEESQKLIAEKNEKIKTISNTLIELQRKDLDLAYLKEQCSNLDRKVKLNEETIQTLVKDNESLKKLMAEKSNIDQETIRGLRQEIQLAKTKVQQQKYEYDLQIKAKESILISKTNDVKLRNQIIDRQKKVVKQLQNQAEVKLFQFQKSLNCQRNVLQIKIDQLKTKLGSAEGEKQQIIVKNTTLLQQIQKHKLNITALQYSQKVMSQEAATMTKQIIDLRVIKDKYGQLLKEYKFLQQQFASVRRNLELSLQNKEVNLNEMLNKFEEGKERNDKIKNQLEDRIKLLIVKSQQLESNLQTNKNTIEKSKRTNQNLNKENVALREQNAIIREELKVAEKRIITIEGDYSGYSSKYEREVNNFKFLLQKYKDQKATFEKQNDSMKDKIQRLQENKKENEDKQNQWKAKERHYEERLEKEQNKLKETSAKYELIIKQHEHTINQHVTQIDNLTNDNNNLKKKVNQFQLIAIKTKESIERLKKDVKLAEQKINSLESQLKNKGEQIDKHNQKITAQELKIHEKQYQYTKLKQENLQQINKSGKQQKIIDMLNKDIAKLTATIDQQTSNIKSKEEHQQQLREQIKNKLEELARQKIKNHKIQSDYDKFKDTINQIIRIQFTRILNTPTNSQKNTERLRESQVSEAKSQKSIRQKQQLDAGVLTNSLVEKLHQTKSSLWKMVELNRILKHQNSKLNQQSESSNNKYQFAQLELHRDIQLLQDEMDNIINDKEEECQNYDNLVVDLNFKLKQKQTAIDELRSDIQEYEAIVKGLKLDFETNNDLNDKKVNALKASINQLNQKIEYLNLNIACMEDRNHQLQQKTIEQEADIVNHKEMLIKNQRSLIDVKENEARLIKDIQSWKKQFKVLQENNSEIELLLNTQKQTKDKYISMLEEEEKKCQKLNQFITGLIAQKETAIKNELQKSQEVNTLENKLFEMTHERDILFEQNQKNKKKIEENKEQIKVTVKNGKNLQKQLAEEKTKNVRSLQKIKERESDLQIKKEYIKDLQEKYRGLRDKNYKEIRELSNELDDKNMNSLSISKELNQKILKIQNQNKKYFEENVNLKNELQDLTRQIYLQKDKVQDLQFDIKKLTDEKTNLEDQLASKQFIIMEKIDQIKKLQAIIDEERTHIQNLQGQYQANQNQFNHNINEITNDFNFKLQTSARDYEQKIQILSKQNQYANQKLRILEQEHSRALIEKKSEEINHDQTVKGFEQKIKKVENERLTNILTKNAEIKAISQQRKSYLDKLKDKEAQVRKLALQLEQNKLATGSLSVTASHAQEQAKHRQKLLQKQIESFKLKEKQNSDYRQKLQRILHGNQAEVRKLIAQAMKRVLQTCVKSDSEKLYAITKGLQSGVVSAMMNRLSDSE